MLLWPSHFIRTRFSSADLAVSNASSSLEPSDADADADGDAGADADDDAGAGAALPNALDSDANIGNARGTGLLTWAVIAVI